MATHHMSAIDNAWLRMDQPGNLLIVNTAMWSAEPMDHARVRAVIDERMVQRFPRFRQHPAGPTLPLGRADWVDDEDFDLDRHIREVTLPDPGDQAALQAYVSGQSGLPLDPAHPLWQIHLISGFGGGSALMFRMHHAISDGVALTRVMLSLTEAEPPGAFTEVHDPSTLESLVDVVGSTASFGLGLALHPSRVLGLARAGTRSTTRLLHLALLPDQPASVLTGAVGPDKLATWTPPIPLDDVKSVGRALGTTLNDVLLAALSAALGDYLLERGTPLPGVRVMIPVNLRPVDEPLRPELGNMFGFYFVDLPTEPMEPRARVVAMHDHVESIKDSPEAVVAFGFLTGLGAAPQIVEDLGVAFFGSKAAGVVTNVPGPREPVHLGGAQVSGMIGWVPRGGSMGFGVSIFSYANQVTVGFSTDAGLMPDPERLQELFLAELATLIDLTRGPTVDPA